jgi:uncharacterized membrane protein YoaK (UPF0700 family)
MNKEKVLLFIVSIIMISFTLTAIIGAVTRNDIALYCISVPMLFVCYIAVSSVLGPQVTGIQWIAKTTLKVYALTLVIPIALTIMALIMLVMGTQVSRISEVLHLAWVDYYFTGNLMNVIAWRWHLILLFLAWLISLTSYHSKPKN